MVCLILDARKKKFAQSKKVAGSTVQCSFTTINVFTKKGDSHAEKECVLSVSDFDSAFAWWVADSDRHRSYRFFRFHKKDEFLITIGGDTGGRHFKFVLLFTHKDNANSGKESKVVDERQI